MSSQRWMREDFRLDVECRLCGYAGPADGWEDREVSKWGWDCPGCDYPHSHYIDDDRGAVTPAASFWMFAAAIAGIVLFLYQPFIFWTAVGVFAYAAVLLAIICVFAGAKNNQPEEGDQ